MGRVLKVKKAQKSRNDHKNAQKRRIGHLLKIPALVIFSAVGFFVIRRDFTQIAVVVKSAPEQQSTDKNYKGEEGPINIKEKGKLHKIESGWDEAGKELYKKKMEDIVNMKPPTKIVNLASEGDVTVSNVEGGWWNQVDGKAFWEKKTFEIFRKYVAPETTVIDFGTWIGPTLLFHGQFSKRSYGIEADPAAYATVEYNVEQNRKRDWGGPERIIVQSACVSAPEHVGTMIMKASKPGESMSGISEKQARPAKISWEVKCYTLPSILEQWGVEFSEKEPVMIKIDIESYECKLVPSFYEWLKDVDQMSLPTIFVSFHPQIEDCTDDEWAKILKFFKLYKEVNAKADVLKLPINSETTFEEFQQMKLNYNFRSSPEFVLTNKK